MDVDAYNFMLFGGKGGVGKTSVAAATALRSAAQGTKTLVISTDPAHSLSDSLGISLSGTETKIRDNLFGLEIDAASLLEEYKMKNGALIKQIADEGTFFSKDDISDFFDLSLPGMDELMALLKIIDILAGKKYDLIILDTAPTGHTIRLLELPNLMSAYVRVLAEMRRKHHVVVRMMVGRYIKDKADEFIDTMHKDVERLKEVLKNATTCFVPVLIPEAMAVAETKRLLDVLRKYEIHVHKIVLNRVIVSNCSFCTMRMHGQQKYIAEIKKLGDIIEIPLFPCEIKGDTLQLVSKALAQEKYSLPQPSTENVDTVKFDSLSIPDDTKFLLFGGKGGVGKTSCAASVALHEAAAGKKVLLFSTDPAHSIGDSLGVSCGNTITSVNDTLSALEIDSYALLATMKHNYRQEIHNFFSSVFKSTTKATIDAPYDRKVMESLFDLAPPGIDEIMAFKTMMDLMEEDTYDLIVLDTAPTGHTIRLLEMPHIAEEWVRTLLAIQEKYPISFELGETLQDLLKIITKVRKVLIDSTKSEFVIVSIPESLSVLETSDLVQGLKKLKVNVQNIIINKIVPTSSCNFCMATRNQQIHHVQQLQALGLQTIGVELFAQEIQGLEALKKLANRLY